MCVCAVGLRLQGFGIKRVLLGRCSFSGEICQEENALLNLCFNFFFVSRFLTGSFVPLRLDFMASVSSPLSASDRHPQVGDELISLLQKPRRRRRLD